MKREFKKGDRVLVRDSDSQEWVSGVFEEAIEHLFKVINDNGYPWAYYQCRHIDDFRNGDEVQVRNSENYEWRNAIYAVYVPNAPFQHWVFPEDMDSFSLDSYALCRWHPSMPWAEKEEPLTLEQRVEALERKLNEQ
jgi:hypothetical protein